MTEEHSISMLSRWYSMRARYSSCFGSSSADRFDSFIHSLYPVSFDVAFASLRKQNYLLYKDKLATIQRRWRIKKYVSDMINGAPSFSTPVLISLTFRDDVFASTDASTRKKYVRDYLNSVFSDYMACLDYGKMNRREHYHAISITPILSYDTIYVGKRGRLFVRIRDAPEWSYGYWSICPIQCCTSRTIHYALKSSNYAFKAMDGTVKPFHKRCASRFVPLFSDDDFGVDNGVLSQSTEKNVEEVLDNSSTFYGKIYTSYSKQFSF